MQRIGVIMHGVTGRMGYNQHLVRSILAIRDQGGVTLADGSRVQVDPIIVGRNADKLERIARRHGIARWSTDLDAALADPEDAVFFDAGATLMRAELLEKALAPASTSIARSRSPTISASPSRSRARRGPRGASTAWCRTSCSCAG